MADILAFQDLSFSYGEGRGALLGLNFSIPEGAFALIKGPSGAGKSTLLRLVARLEEPAGGRILFRGKSLEEYAPADLRRRLGFIQQSPALIADTVRNNLLLPFTFAVNADRARPDDKTLLDWLDRLSLAGRGGNAGISLDDQAQTLSLGQQQRLCLARGLLLEPELLLMDEPTSALDMDSRRIVEALAEECNANGVTIMMVSHNDYLPGRPFLRLEVRSGAVSLMEGHSA